MNRLFAILMSAVIVAVFWLSWNILIVGPVPLTKPLDLSVPWQYYVLDAGISRYWDIAAAPVFVWLIIWRYRRIFQQAEVPAVKREIFLDAIGLWFLGLLINFFVLLGTPLILLLILSSVAGLVFYGLFTRHGAWAFFLGLGLGFGIIHGLPLGLAAALVCGFPAIACWFVIHAVCWINNGTGDFGQ